MNGRASAGKPLDAREQRRVREASDALLTLRPGAEPADGIVEVIHEHLRPSKTILYAVRPGLSDDLAVDFSDARGTCPNRLRPVYDAFLRGKGVRFNTFNPLRPERLQRNRAQNCVELHRLCTPESAEASKRVLAEVYPEMGARDYRTLRVLVCEGSSLLAYVGVLQPEAPSLEQADVLRRLIPALQRRLSIERLLADDAARAASIDATLELIPSATFLSDEEGRVVHANALGRLALGGLDRAAIVDGVRDATRAGGRPGWRAIRLAATSRVAAALVIAPSGTSVERAVASMARTLGLTPAQTRVLSWIAGGYATRRIAAELGVAERTVEAHITVILDRAQVETRAALLAKFLDRRVPVYSR